MTRNRIRFYSCQQLWQKLLIVLVAGGFFLSSCASSTRQTYDLGVFSALELQNKAPLKKRPLQILIADPTALKMLDGQNIVVRKQDASLSYLKNAQWGDRLPNIVQARIAQFFEDAEVFAGVGRPGEGLTIDYQFISELRIFGIDITSTGESAHVEIAVKILDDKNGDVLHARVFSAQKPLKGLDNHNYTEALDDAFLSVLNDILQWTVEKL